MKYSYLPALHDTNINHYAMIECVVSEINKIKQFSIQGKMFSAPFFHVGFADFWLADQLNSLVTALLDFQFLICFYFANNFNMDAAGGILLYAYII